MSEANRPLAGRTAVVTGGVSGIGRGVALALARAGAAVGVGSLPSRSGRLDQLSNYYPDDVEFSAVAADLRSYGAYGLAAPLDLSDDASVDRFIAEVGGALGAVDILVCAAGADCLQYVAEHDDALWHKVIDTNLNGTYRAVKRLFPGMVERGWGRIVIVASTAASVGGPGKAAYCASKAGLLGLMRCVAMEGAAHGVTCNAISPGTVDTRLSQASMAQRVAREGGRVTMEAVRASFLAGVPQRRFIEPDELGALAAFLCREEARGITMEDLRLSAGALW